LHGPIDQINDYSSNAWSLVVRDLIDVGVCLLDLRTTTAASAAVSTTLQATAARHEQISSSNSPLEAHGNSPDGSLRFEEMNSILACDAASPPATITDGTIPTQLAFESSIDVLDWLDRSPLSPRTAAVSGHDDAVQHSIPIIDATADSAHATGYHDAGAMSARYNAHRQGFVFSDGNEFDVLPEFPDFAPRCNKLFAVLHSTANHVLQAIAQRLELHPPGDATNWFQQALGPTIRHSQWHIKRYVDALSDNAKADTDNVAAKNGSNSGSNEEANTRVLLPTHTDPSLISVVLVHRPDGGVHSDGAMGLQYYHTKHQAWMEVPYSGHDVAIVFVGSVLQHITGGYMIACKHRVVAQKAVDSDVLAGNEPGTMRQPSFRRMAATLFVRPAPDAVLSILPSPTLIDRTCKQLTFAQWNAKTAKKYGKAVSTKDQPTALPV
jgi:2OG-Fe(II) oxygenase superfamily